MDIPGMDVTPLSEADFERFRRFIYEHAGISMGAQKRQLVAGRLLKRLRHLGLSCYGDYFRFVMQNQGGGEKQVLIDSLTTNETYFFREPQHFEFLAQHVLPSYIGTTCRVWSAACSSGEEPYTIAMVMAEVLKQGHWSVIGSDISHKVLAAARAGIYPLERATAMPREIMSEYCLKGVRSQAGQIAIDPRLKERVSFRAFNLKRPLPDNTAFDVIFLRNILIYFDTETKREIVNRVAGVLKPGGYLFVSHVESLHGVVDHLESIKPSIYRMPRT